MSLNNELKNWLVFKLPLLIQNLNKNSKLFLQYETLVLSRHDGVIDIH